MTQKRYELKQCNNGSYYLYYKGVLINNPYVTFDNFHKEDAESIVGELNHLVDENEQLKQEYNKLKHRHSLLHDECIEAECDRDRYHKDVLSLEKENKYLKSQLKSLNY